MGDRRHTHPHRRRAVSLPTEPHPELSVASASSRPLAVHSQPLIARDHRATSEHSVSHRRGVAGREASRAGSSQPARHAPSPPPSPPHGPAHPSTRQGAPPPPPPPLGGVDAAQLMQQFFQGLAQLTGQGAGAGRVGSDPFPLAHRDFVRLHTPRFDGSGPYSAAEEWLDAVQETLRPARSPLEFHTELATTLLDGDARF